MLQKKSRQDNGKFSLSLELQFPSKAQAEAIKSAILPELNSAHAKRSKTSVSIKKGSISINIKAGDATALRASFNSCLGSIILSKSISEV